jgi:vanillate O-demethylase ferredoxin subunit
MHDDTSWQRAHVRTLRDLTPTIREFELVPERGVRAWTAGSHVRVRVPVGQRDETRLETRHYSLVGLPAESAANGAYRIAVKRLEPGRGGSRHLWSLEEGAELSIGEPANHFELSPAAPQYLLVAGGIGVTPLVAMARTLAARGAALRMCYAARGADELAYRDELADALGASLAVFSGQSDDRIDLDAEIAALAPGGQLYVCGPIVLLDAAREAWERSGRALGDLRFETFGNTGRHAAVPFWVELADRGRRIEVPADRSLLDVLEELGVPALSDCRRGECGLCALQVVRCDGIADHRDVFFSARQKAANERFCTCVSRVSGGGIVLDSAYRPD